ncbi:hypothetical protein, partial [Ruminococcus sp.]|uniref:hypothetical protein n=1 Tax=Ruminococcus sp. TaxID=41978 RepID=UPI0025DBF8E4
MARSYKHIQQYEKEIFELKGKGLTLREIGERLGFTHKQLHDFITRYNANQRKIAAGIVIKPKGRPRKDGTELPPSVQQLSKIAQLQYEMSRKDAKIKALEMENELMRDFLSLTERKLDRRSSSELSIVIRTSTASARCADSSMYLAAAITVLFAVWASLQRIW